MYARTLSYNGYHGAPRSLSSVVCIAVQAAAALTASTHRKNFKRCGWQALLAVYARTLSYNGYHGPHTASGVAGRPFWLCMHPSIFELSGVHSSAGCSCTDGIHTQKKQVRVISILRPSFARSPPGGHNLELHSQGGRFYRGIAMSCLQVIVKGAGRAGCHLQHL